MKQLKIYLTSNSVFSALSGLSMLVASDKLNDLFEISNHYIFPFIGLNLLIFSAFVWYVSRKQLANKLLVSVISILDLLWVVGSVVIVAFDMFEISKTGQLMISLVAVWIAFLAYKQFQNNK